MDSKLITTTHIKGFLWKLEPLSITSFIILFSCMSVSIKHYRLLEHETSSIYKNIFQKTRLRHFGGYVQGQ